MNNYMYTVMGSKYLRSLMKLVMLSIWCLFILYLKVTLIGSNNSAKVAFTNKKLERPVPLRVYDTNIFPRNISQWIEGKLIKYLNITEYRNVSSKLEMCLQIESPRGQLGNQMYQVASVIGIALKNGMIPYYKTLKGFVENGKKSVIDKCELEKAKWVTFREREFGKFDLRMLSLSKTFPGRNIMIGQYLHSYKYFIDVERFVRHEFTFSTSVRNSVIEFFARNAGYFGLKFSNHILIGIHARRHDLILPILFEQGYALPEVSYYKKAMQYFKRHLGHKLLFIICSDDSWARNALKNLDENIIISENNSPEVDMAILASCDHVIMSLGTYGWWGGFLSQGNVIYYSGHPRPGSDLSKRFNVEDVMPKNWIGLK